MTSSINPAIFFRKRLCMFFSSISLSLRVHPCTGAIFNFFIYTSSLLARNQPSFFAEFFIWYRYPQFLVFKNNIKYAIVHLFDENMSFHSMHKTQKILCINSAISALLISNILKSCIKHCSISELKQLSIYVNRY